MNTKLHRPNRRGCGQWTIIEAAALGFFILGSAAASEARLTVTALSVNGMPLPVSAYVGVTPVTKPWNDPIREEVLEPGQVASYGLPAGTYRALCLADGFELLLQPAFSLEAGKGMTIECRLARLVPIAGHIQDNATGRPIADALLGDPLALLDNLASQSHAVISFSALAEPLFRRPRLTRSLEDGSFRFFGPSGRKIPLWVEAAGYSPKFDGGLLIPPGGLQDLRLDLILGGSINLQLEASPPDGARVFLRPTAINSFLTEDSARRTALRRWSQQADQATAFRWPSLPAGEYDVMVETAISGLVDLRRVVLQPGQELSLSETLVSVDRSGRKLSIPPTTEDDEPRTSVPSDAFVLLSNAPAITEDPTVSVWRSDHWQSIEAHSSRVSGGLSLRLSGACRRGEIARVSLGELLTFPTTIETENCRRRSPSVATLNPRASVAAHLSIPDGLQPPTFGKLVAMPCSNPVSATGSLGGTLPMAIEDNTLQSDLPAGCWDLTLLTPRFGPVSWPGTRLGARDSRELISRRLQPAGRLVFRITDLESRPIADARAEVFLASQSSTLAQSTIRKLPTTSLMTATTNDRGWVELDGLSGESIVLRATAPGYSPEISGAIEVRPGEERFLEDLSLANPARLRVQMVAAEELSQAKGPGLRVILKSKAACGWLQDLAFDAIPDDQGIAVFELVPPGNWSLSALRRDVTGHEETAKIDLELIGGEERWIELQGTSRRFQGRVLLAGNSLPEANLDLAPWPNQAAEVTRLSTTTKAYGEFEVRVPVDSTFAAMVTWSSESGFHQTSVSEVRFEDPADPVDIELPAGILKGVVLDEAGSPVSNARVDAARLPAPPSDNPEHLAVLGWRPVASGPRTGPDGTFELVGMESGEWVVRGSTETSSTEDRTVTVEDDLTSPPWVTLSLFPEVTLHGIVETPSGVPIGTTSLTVQLREASSGAIIDRRRTQSLPDGTFELTLAHRPSTEFDLVAQASDFPLLSQPISLDHQDLKVLLPRRGGIARLELRSPNAEPIVPRLARNALIFVSPQGGMVARDQGIDPRHGSLSDDGRVMSVQTLVLSEGRWTVILQRLVKVGNNDWRPELTPVGSFDIVSGTETSVVLELPKD